MWVEVNGQSVGACLLGMVIWADRFVILERDFLGKMVGVDVMMEMVVEVVVLEAVDVVQAGFFCLFQAWLFGEYDGCSSGGGGCGWDGGVGLVEVVSSVGMGVGIGGADNRVNGVVSSGEKVSVVGGGARWRDCCRFPDEIFG